MSFNTIIDWNSCTAEQQRQLLMRPAISASESITRTVNDILDNVKARGDEALREYSAKFDKTTVTALKVSAEEIAAASRSRARWLQWVCIFLAAPPRSSQRY